MRAPDLYLEGRRVDLVKRIGKGGEGEVWLAGGEPKRAVKYYTIRDLSDREAKVRAMVRLALADSYRLASFPRQIATTKAGAFVGFSMSLVEGGRQIHELYGVKSRKIHYPTKDYRFLVRAAANTARAVAQLHTSPCVVGDFNESGVLVADDATVTLIDADSFQLRADGHTHLCLVGKPEFTAPELQGRSLAGVERTSAHDEFALAVAIFELLFMGRHPYAGNYKGPDLTLDQFIARDLFAYSKVRTNGVTPPAGTATLDDFPPEIGRGFERAFGPNPTERTTAAEWVGLLQFLEGQLVRCSTEPMHFYPGSAKACPWCRMETLSGAMLFQPNFREAPATTANVAGFDVEKVWAAIRAIPIPAALSLSPPIPVSAPPPTQAALEAKRKRQFNRKLGGAIGAVALILWVVSPTYWILWLIGMILALFVFNSKPSADYSSWATRYAETERRLNEALDQWRARLGHPQLVKLRAEMEESVEEFRRLPDAERQALAKLTAERKERQRHDFLDRYLVQRASIAGIGAGKTATLRSFGIESAADVDQWKILRIPGFGPATAEKLVAWRSGLERRFVYNPAPQPADRQAQLKVQSEFATKRVSLARRITAGETEMTRIATTMNERTQLEDARVSALAKQQEQLATDLEFLGVSKPLKTTPVRFAQPVPQSVIAVRPVTPVRPAAAGVKCPTCRSSMIRRTAHHGANSGRSFWGCSRFPRCRGTRN